MRLLKWLDSKYNLKVNEVTLQEFNNRWKYKTDLEKYGVKELWEEPKPNSNGEYESDCESYSIFLKRNIDGFKDWWYYYCKLNGEGHCILMSNKNSMMIDNNTKEIVHIQEFELMYDITNIRPYKWYELIWKFGTAKLILMYLRTKRSEARAFVRVNR